jgi:hypothetical protein
MVATKQRIPLSGGDEYDALTRWRRFLRWRSKQRKRIKSQYNKRIRRREKEEMFHER